MEKEKLILSQNGNRFYLSVPEKIKIGRYQSHCYDMDEDIVIEVKYINFFRDLNISYSSNEKNLGLMSNYNSICLMYTDFHSIIIPKGIFELNKDSFNRLRKVLKRYDDIFEIELREFYSDNKNDFENYKVNIDYEMIKLENPIKNKNYLFRLKDNNIPKSWIEQSEYLIKKLENLNSKYGNISQNKVNLIDFNGCIPKNIDFVISEIYAKRVDELFKSWNNNNKKSNKMELVEFLFKEYNQINSYGDNYFIILNDKITVLVNVEELKILEFKTMYHNIDMVSYDKLVDCVNNIQKEIDRINEKRVDN